MISLSRIAVGKDFVNREEILKRLTIAYKKHNVALVGPRRIGKSSIAAQFFEILPDAKVTKVIFDVSQNMGTPGKFALRLLISYLEAYLKLKSKDRNLAVLLEDVDIKPINLMELAEGINSNILRRLAQFMVNYYPPSAENEQEVLKRVLIFLEDFAEENKCEVSIVLDEFQAISEFERFSSFGKGRVLPFLQGIVSSQKRVWYLFTGSAISLMTEIVEGEDSPFYGRVEKIDVGGFTKEDSVELINRVSNKPFSGEALALLWAITKGNPYYLVVLANRVNFLSEDKKYIDKNIIEEAFIEEITRGVLYSHCQYFFDTSLGKIGKSSSVLKEVIRILSTGIKSPSGIAKRLGREVSYVGPLLSNLYQLDLILKEGKQYFIADPVLQVWIEDVYGFGLPKIEKIKKKVARNYQENIANLKKDTGHFFESYMRELLSKFDGSGFRERELPCFEKIESLNIFDRNGYVYGKPSNIEIDALCVGKAVWICEFRYRNELAVKKDIDLFIRKKHLVEEILNLRVETLMFISKAGFTEAAMKETDVWLVDSKDLNELLSKFNMRKI